MITKDTPPLQETTLSSKKSLKSLIKDKLNSSVQKKEDQEIIKNIHINFPKDKPTFPVELLEKAQTQDVTVDEDWLLKKAQ